MKRKINSIIIFGLLLLLGACNKGNNTEEEKLPYYNTPDFNASLVGRRKCGSKRDFSSDS